MSASPIRIYVFTPGRDRYASWRGDPGWLSVPLVGATWFHCGEWTGETVERVSWNGPEQNYPAHTIEIETTLEVLDHLISEHGFEDRRD